MKVKKQKIKTEEWNPKNLLTQKNIDEAIESFAHFTFKLTHSNSLGGGLIAEKVDLDGYVCMSNIMSGNEYEIMDGITSKAKITKRINAVIDGTESQFFDNVNINDVTYIKQKLNTINLNQNLNLGLSNKRLKQIIIQEKNVDNKIENKELIILRSSGFAKILSKALQKEKELQNDDKNIRTRKKAQLSFGGANPINIGVNGYLMSNVLYFSAPEANKNINFEEAYKIHHSGLKLYDLVNIDFLKEYLNYQTQINNKTKINNYLKNKEQELIADLFYYMKSVTAKKYELLENNKESFSNKQVFSDNLLKTGNEDKLLAFYLIGKNPNSNSDEIFINCLLSVLKSKTFYIEKEAKNLNLSETNQMNIRKSLRELLWQNI